MRRDREGRHLGRTQGLPPRVMALGLVPMCSYQMERMFSTTRIPGKDTGMGSHQGARAGAWVEASLPAMGHHASALLPAAP